MAEQLISLSELYKQIPNPTYVEADSTMHWALTKLGWRELHRLVADDKVFIKLEKPNA